MTDFSDEYWMRYAIKLAHKAELQGEIPVGAVLINNETNEVLGEGWNQSIQSHDPSAHAEMLAIREAGQVAKNYRLTNTTLYVTLEPCPMCAGAMVHSRIDKLVFAASDQKTGAAGSVFNLLDDMRLNHQVEITSGVLADECSTMLSEFFRKRRAQKKQEKALSKSKDQPDC